MASDGRAPAAPEGPTATDPASERGVPALFSWGDVDGDGRLDLAAVSSGGTLQLLVNVGEGRFEDVSELVGLSDVGNAALALWADYDGDGWLDLFVGAREGASRLFRNEEGVFVDMSAGSGLLSEGAVQSAQWFDHDGDGRPDLFVVTAEKNELFRGLEGGFFDLAELPPAGHVEGSGAGGGVMVGADGVDADGLGTQSAPSSFSKKASVHAGGPIGGFVSVDGVNGSGGRVSLLPPLGQACVNEIKNQGNAGCLKASVTPGVLNRLYPLSTNLFVAVGGNVGIGTTSPTARLHVAGAARMTDTLTLAPSGDQALDVSTGSMYKGGALFIHTKGGTENTALGREALATVTAGLRDTATGFRALYVNTTGKHNSAFGALALYNNDIGSYNTAGGVGALFRNTTGDSNTAFGNNALPFNTSGFGSTATGNGALLYNTGSHNTAFGNLALRFNTAGVRNTAIGSYAGQNLTTGNDNIAIGNSGVAGEGATIRVGTAGTHTRAFVAGILGVTTGNANAIPVLIDSAGQLGTVSSSRRFKRDIADMGNLTEQLLELRPVVFHYKQDQKLPNGGEVPLEYGLIAEEVAEVFPDLVIYDEEGLPFTVKYHILSSMLLNELKKQANEVGELRSQLGEQGARLAALEARASPVGTAMADGSR